MNGTVENKFQTWIHVSVTDFNTAFTQDTYNTVFMEEDLLYELIVAQLVINVLFLRNSNLHYRVRKASLDHTAKGNVGFTVVL
jgi:hypothetical protein